MAVLDFQIEVKEKRTKEAVSKHIQRLNYFSVLKYLKHINQHKKRRYNSSIVF